MRWKGVEVGQRRGRERTNARDYDSSAQGDETRDTAEEEGREGGSRETQRSLALSISTRGVRAKVAEVAVSRVMDDQLRAVESTV